MSYVAGYSEQAQPSVVYAYEGYGAAGPTYTYTGSLEDAYLRAEEEAAAWLELIMEYRRGGHGLQPGYLGAYRSACARRNALRRALED